MKVNEVYSCILGVLTMKEMIKGFAHRSEKPSLGARVGRMGPCRSVSSTQKHRQRSPWMLPPDSRHEVGGNTAGASQ